MATPLNGAEVLEVLGQANPGGTSPAATTQTTRTRDIAQAPKLIDKVTAAGTTQGTATTLNTAGLINVSVGTANQGIILPTSTTIVGKKITVYNNTGATIKIYPFGTETIDGGSASAAVTLTSANRGASFTCVVSGNWISELIGAVSS